MFSDNDLVEHMAEVFAHHVHSPWEQSAIYDWTRDALAHREYRRNTRTKYLIESRKRSKEWAKKNPERKREIQREVNERRKKDPIRLEAQRRYKREWVRKRRQDPEFHRRERERERERQRAHRERLRAMREDIRNAQKG